MSPETVRALDHINQRFYSRGATDFDRTRHGHWTGWNQLVERVNLDLHRPLRVLDVGCGNGRFASFLAEKVGACNLHYTGCDRSEELLESAQARLREVGCTYRLRAINLLGDDYTECPPLADGTEGFDLVVCFGVLHHVPSSRQPQFLQRCQDVVRPKGALCLSFWQFGGDPRFARRRVPWTWAVGEGLIQQEHVAETDGDDWLLRWGQASDKLVRYCRHNAPSHIERLLAGNSRQVTYFDGDGASQKLNRYTLSLAGSEPNAS